MARDAHAGSGSRPTRSSEGDPAGAYRRMLVNLVCCGFADLAVEMAEHGCFDALREYVSDLQRAVWDNASVPELKAGLVSILESRRLASFSECPGQEGSTDAHDRR